MLKIADSSGEEQ